MDNNSNSNSNSSSGLALPCFACCCFCYSYYNDVIIIAIFVHDIVVVLYAAAVAAAITTYSKYVLSNPAVWNEMKGQHKKQEQKYYILCSAPLPSPALFFPALPCPALLPVIVVPPHTLLLTLGSVEYCWHVAGSSGTNIKLVRCAKERKNCNENIL